MLVALVLSVAVPLLALAPPQVSLRTLLFVNRGVQVGSTTHSIIHGTSALRLPVRLVQTRGGRVWLGERAAPQAGKRFGRALIFCGPLASVLMIGASSLGRRRCGLWHAATSRRHVRCFANQGRSVGALAAYDVALTMENGLKGARRDTTDFSKVRTEFPALCQDVRPGVPLVYLDSAATSQKPVQVISELGRFYREDNSNVHRGTHTLALRSTDAFEAARDKLAAFIGAADPAEVVFTRNATEAINLVARTWARANIRSGDEIILTVMEHHSNLVPWQLLAEDIGATLSFVGITSEGMLNRSELLRLLGRGKARLVALSHVSNVLGCVNPVEWVAKQAHRVGARVLVDACQSIPHRPVDVQRLGADWLVASGHKMCGPTGVGFLWGRADLLRASPPFLGGGEMIDEVTLERSTYADIPHKLEAGTPAFAEAIALGAACDYLTELGMADIHKHETSLARHMWQQISDLPGVVLYGPPPSSAPDRAAVVSFNLVGCHPLDLATLVNEEQGVAMRAGHHCCQPLHHELGVAASARLSAHFYNTHEDIDVAANALRSAAGLLRGDMPTMR